MSDLILEIYSEEIPSRLQYDASLHLKKFFIDELLCAGLQYNKLDTFVTPRRLTLIINDLLESSTPYKENQISNAKSAMKELEKILEQDLKEAKESAEVKIMEQESQLKSDENFLSLDTDQQKEVLKATELARSELQSATKPSTVLVLINRYKEKGKPLQLAMIDKLLNPKDSSEGDVVPSSMIKTTCKLSRIKDLGDLDEWINALRLAAKKELDKGNSISL